MRILALASAPLAPIALIGGWTVAASLRPTPFDAVRGTISALAAHDAPHRWVMTTGLALVGLAHVVTAYALVEARPTGRILLALGGVFTGLVAVFAQPSDLHFAVAAPAFVLLAIWPAFAGLPTRLGGVAAAGLLSLLLIWLATELGGDQIGLVERILAGAQALWPLALVMILVGRGRLGVAPLGSRA